MPEVGVTKWNSSGIRKLLRSPEIQADMVARAEKIAAAAGGDTIGFFAGSEVQKNRARGFVVAGWYQARAAEERGHALSGAVDAGRGTTR